MGGGGGECCQTFFFFFPCSADHEWDWPRVKYQVVFIGLTTKTLNMRNNGDVQEI